LFNNIVLFFINYIILFLKYKVNTQAFYFNNKYTTNRYLCIEQI